MNNLLSQNHLNTESQGFGLNKATEIKHNGMTCRHLPILAYGTCKKPYGYSSGDI